MRKISKFSMFILVMLIIVFCCFILHLIFAILNKKTVDIILAIVYWLLFTFLINIYIICRTRKDVVYSIAYNRTYYIYNENIFTSSKYLYTKKNRKKETIEYRLIDNELVIQLFSIISIDETKALLTFYPPKYKNGVKKVDLQARQVDHIRNITTQINESPSDTSTSD
jgi:hypothetical protein